MIAFSRIKRVAAAAAFVAAGVCVTRTGQASVDLAAAYGSSVADQQSTSTETSFSTGRKAFNSYGLIANFPTSSKSYGFTAGFLYTEVGSHTVATAAGMTDEYDVKLPYFEVPVVADYWPLDSFCVGMGGYYGFPAGNVSESGAQSFAGVANPYSYSGTFNSLGIKNDDFGLVLHAQLKIPVGTAAFLTLNSLYLFGLENIDSTGQSVIRNYSVIIQGGIGINI